MTQFLIEKDPPKVAHFFWGDTPMSWLRYLTLYSFRKYNPDWTIKLYLSKSNIKNKTWAEHNELDYFKYYGCDFSEKLANINVEILQWKFPEKKTSIQIENLGPSYQSDLFGWSKMYYDGGFYFDMDILFVKSMDSVYEYVSQGPGAICIYEGKFMIGALSSIPGCKFFNDIYKSALSVASSENYQSAGVYSVYHWLDLSFGDRTAVSPDKIYTNKIYEQRFKQLYPEVVVLDYDYFYYFGQNISGTKDFSDIYEKNLFEEFINNKNSTGLHWYGGNPHIQKINIGMSEKNYKNYNNTLSECVKYIMDTKWAE